MKQNSSTVNNTQGVSSNGAGNQLGAQQANLNLQKSIEVYESLKNTEDAYWKTVDGLTNEQKVDVFIRILRKELPENRTEYQLRFLSQQCMQFEFFRNISQNYGEEVVRDCVRYLRYEDLSNDQILFEQGERGTRFYIILQGSVHILIKLPEKGNVKKFKNQRINTIHAGKAFGEVALMNDNTMRTATIKSAEFCRFAYLEKDDFKRIIGKEATEQINQRYLFIKDYNFFDEFTYRELMTFSYHFNETTFKRGEIIFDIFDTKIDDVYFVKEGSFLLQGSFDITQSYIPNLKVKRQHRTFNIDPLIERTIFGLEYFNKDLVKSMHFAIKNLEEMSSSANQSNQETPSNGKSLNPIDEQAEKFIPFSPYRIGRVICDSTRGTVYRVKASEIEQRLWKEDSKFKFNTLSQVTFSKQVEKIQQFIQKSLEEKSHLELLREQAKYLKPPIEYLGKKEDLQHLFQSDNQNQNQRNSQVQLCSKPSEQFKLMESMQIRSSSPSIVRNGGSPMNNHISLLMDLDKFFKSSIEFGISDKSPFQQSIQKIRLTSPILSPTRVKNTIHPCITNNSHRSIEISPRKPAKNVTIFDLNKMDNYLNISPQSKRFNQGDNTTSNLIKGNTSNHHKTFSLCVFHADDNNNNNSSTILNRRKQTSSHIIHEEESAQGDFNYGSSVILNRKLSPRRLGLKKSESSFSLNSDREYMEHQQRLQYINNQEEEENKEEALKQQKKDLKQCSPQRRSPDKQSIYEENEILKSEKRLKKDFMKNIQKNNQKIQQNTNNNNNVLKMKNEKLNPNEMLNKVFYFAHNHNKIVKRELEVQQFKKQFLGEDPEETNPSNVIRGNTEEGLNEYDQDLLQATTLDDYKRRKFQRKLLDEQENKFQKIFSNDLVELGKVNEHSEYNNRVKQLYIKNRKQNKIIFDQTAGVVKQQNCSYNQVREYFYKQGHKDRFFQDIFQKKAASRVSSTKNANNSTSYTPNITKVSNLAAFNTQQTKSPDQIIQSTKEQQQQQQSSKKYSFQSQTPNKRRQSKLILKDKRGSSYSGSQSNNNNNNNNNNNINNNTTTPSAFEEIKDLSDPLEQSQIENQRNQLNEQQEIQQMDNLQYEKEMEQLLQSRPDYLQFLLQKNQQNSSQINQMARTQYDGWQMQAPLIISAAPAVQNQYDYYINSAQKIQQALQLEQEEQMQLTKQKESKDISYHQTLGRMQFRNRNRNRTEANEYDEDENSMFRSVINNKQNDDQRIDSLYQTEGSPRLNQNHLVHLKYTPTSTTTQKQFEHKSPNLSMTGNSQNIFNQTKDNFNSATTPNKFSQTHSSMSTYGRHKRRHLDTSTLKTQMLSPMIIDSSTNKLARSQINSKSPHKPQHLSISFNDTSKKQEINVEEKNTFLSQNHRKLIVNSKIQQRELFLKSKSSVKRYSSVSTNCGDSSIFPSQIDVNSKCLAKIPSWNASQSIKSQKNHLSKNKIQPRSLQIVSSTSSQQQQYLQNQQQQLQQMDGRLQTTVSQFDSNSYQKFQPDHNKIHTDPFDDTSTSIQKTQYSVYQNHSYTQH